MCKTQKQKDKRLTVRKVHEIEQEDHTELFVGALDEKQTQVNKETDATVLGKDKWTETLRAIKEHFLLIWILELSATSFHIKTSEQ